VCVVDVCVCLDFVAIDLATKSSQVVSPRQKIPNIVKNLLKKKKVLLFASVAIPNKSFTPVFFKT
jgi:hypothetical protein